MPGVDVGLQAEDPTIAELLKPLGYATGQFGKNHLGDLNEFLPTVHGFDEFFGNLYHLNAEEEPEHAGLPDRRGASRASASASRRAACIHSLGHRRGRRDEVDDRYGPVGKQRIEDTGPLTKKRMETIDDETTGACIDFIKRQHEAGHAVLRAGEHDPHALPDAHQAGEPRPGRAAGSRRTTTR